MLAKFFVAPILMVLLMLCTSFQVLARTENIFITQREQTLTPKNSQYDYFLQVMPYWNMNHAEFTVYFRHSPTLNQALSSLTLYVDGTPFSTMKLATGGKGKGVVKASIPSGKLQPGFHQFTVFAHLRSHQDACQDEDDPANWLVIEKTSLIHLKTETSVDIPNLSKYPYPYLSNSVTNPWQVTLIVPDKASNQELETAYEIISHLARKSVVHGSNAMIVRASDWDPKRDRKHAILVGKRGSFPVEWLHMWEALPQMMQSDIGYLHQIAERLDDRTERRMLLLVTGISEEGVQIAGEALTYASITRQISGSTSLIAESKLALARKLENENNFQINKSAAQGKVTLAQLGYGPITLSGQSTSSTSFTFKTPPTWKYTEGAGVRFRLRYSSLLDENRSALTVSVNGVPMATKPLLLSNAGDMEFFVPFLSDMGVGREVQVTIAANMYLKTGECKPKQTEMRRFVTIDPSSEIVLPHVHTPTAWLSRFPGAFLSEEGILEETTAILSSNLTSHELTALAKIVGAYATYIEHRQLKVLQANTKKDVEGNVWIIDVAGMNDALINWNDKWHFPIVSTPQGLRSQIVPILSDTEKLGGVIEQIFLPGRKAAMIMTASTTEMLIKTAEMVSKRDQIPLDSTATVAIHTTDHQTLLFDIKQEPQEELAQKVGNKISETFGYLVSNEGRVVLFFIVFSATIIFILCVILVQMVPGIKKKWIERKGSPKRQKPK